MVITAETTVRVKKSWVTIPRVVADPTRMKLNSPICAIPRPVNKDVITPIQSAALEFMATTVDHRARDFLGGGTNPADRVQCARGAPRSRTQISPRSRSSASSSRAVRPPTPVPPYLVRSIEELEIVVSPLNES